jgi:Skp family chaperone for outer membrane proteins
MKRPSYAIIPLIAGIIGILLAVAVTYYNNHVIDVKDIGNTKIAVLDTEKTKTTAKCFSVQELLNQKIANVLTSMKNAESSIKDEYKKIKMNHDLSPTQRNKEISKIEAKWATESANHSAEMQKIKSMCDKLSHKMQQTLQTIIKRIAIQTNMDLVINSTNGERILVFYNTPQIDITDIVIRELDKVLPKITLEEIEKW